MSTLDVVALQRYGTTTILGISVVHGVAEPLRYVFIVAGRVIVCGYAATVITVTPQSLGSNHYPSNVGIISICLQLYGCSAYIADYTSYCRGIRI